MSKTTIILVRHCEAEGNKLRVFQGHWNGKITDNGKKQLNYLSGKMKNIPFDYLYSSPLSRAISTAKACNVNHNLPIHINKNLIEINGGDWEGKRWDSFPNDFSKEITDWTYEPHKFTAPNGEAMTDVYKRMSETITAIAKEHQGKRICIASHGCSIRNFLCFAKGFDVSSVNDVEWCDNTGICVIEYDEKFKPSIVVENDSNHIPKDISTFQSQSWWKKENKDKLIFD